MDASLSEPSSIREHLLEVRNAIETAALSSGRRREDVTLVAVSKTHPAEAVMEVMDCNQSIFGESRIQEAKEKIPRVSRSARWHFIGHLQKNKVRQALSLFELLHSVDSLELAQSINRIAAELGLHPRVLLEVNVAGEHSKHGFSPTVLQSQIDDLIRLDRLQIEGLMTIPPFSEDPEHSRPHFAALRELRDELQSTAKLGLPALSMGMSGDYAVAIEEGATLVRVGTKIFGRRPPRTV